jgi:hypothetical protein
MGYPLVPAGEALFDAWQRPPAEGVQQFAVRMARCADDADAVLAQLGQVQMQQWQSPAGRAYRSALAGRLTELRRARDSLREASALLVRQAAAAMAGY